MAVLNAKEKIIRNAAQSDDPFLHGVFERLLSFYKDLSHYQDYDDTEIIIYLYCGNHKGQTYQRIAKILNIGTSTLEDRRKKIVKMFFYFMDEANAEIFKAS